MTVEEEIKVLKQRVEELEKRPFLSYPVPYPVYPVYPVYPSYPHWPGYYITCSGTQT